MSFKKINLLIVVMLNLIACGGGGGGTESQPPPVTDTDGDGISDDQDAFPTDPDESVDTDGDGIGDNADIDDNQEDNSGDSDGSGSGTESPGTENSSDMPSPASAGSTSPPASIPSMSVVGVYESFYSNHGLYCSYGSCASSYVDQKNLLILDSQSKFVRCFSDSDSTFTYALETGTDSSGENSKACYSGTYETNAGESKADVILHVNLTSTLSTSNSIDQSQAIEVYKNTSGDSDFIAYVPNFEHLFISVGDYTGDLKDYGETVDPTLYGFNQVLADLGFNFDNKTITLGEAAIDHDGDSQTTLDGDCNDYEATVNSKAQEICGDEIDNNCDGDNSLCDSGTIDTTDE